MLIVVAELVVVGGWWVRGERGCAVIVMGDAGSVMSYTVGVRGDTTSLRGDMDSVTRHSVRSQSKCPQNSASH